jgi:hypothetical protein
MPCDPHRFFQRVKLGSIAFDVRFNSSAEVDRETPGSKQHAIRADANKIARVWHIDCSYCRMAFIQ